MPHYCTGLGQTHGAWQIRARLNLLEAMDPAVPESVDAVQDLAHLQDTPRAGIRQCGDQFSQVLDAPYRQPTTALWTPLERTPEATILPGRLGQKVRKTLWLAACAMGRMIIRSMFTCGGRVATQATASAMSAARSGSETPA